MTVIHQPGSKEASMPDQPRQALVITRREGQRVAIGNPADPDGYVLVTSIKGNRVRLQFEFPRDVPVNREEIAERITAEGSPA